MKRLLFSLALASLVSAQIPRSEYPQPQFEREAWLSLNGPWRFAFDDRDIGIDRHWESNGEVFSRSILVPFCFESPMSGIGDPGFHPWVWYRRTFEVPPSWAGKRVLLHFGAVDYRAMVWVNGSLAGMHEGGNVPFLFDITPLLVDGANTLTVRAEDPPTDRSIPRGKQYWEPRSKGIWYKRTSGIWQPVWLEAAGANYLTGVRITADENGRVRFEASVARPGDGLEFSAAIAGGPRASAPVEEGRASAEEHIALPRLWSPDAPNLYDVVFELRQNNAVLDTVRSYFGFRTVEARKGKIWLNGEPIYLKMVLDQGYWPQSNLTPPSEEAIRYDIQMTKQMGFNGARKHQKLEDPRYLYWADRMGLVVSSEMANAHEFNDAYVGRFTREWMAAVERDYNHPSILFWTPINESWGTPNLKEGRQQDHLKELYSLTHALDATRLVIDNDGWEHTDMTDVFTIHDYARTGAELYSKYKNAGKARAGIPKNGREALAPGYRYNGSPLVLSEFGGIAFIPPGHQVPQEAWGYSGVEKTPEAALARLRGLYEAIAKLPFAGICYTQLTDVEQEVNGLMTYDRKPKYDPAAIRAINGLLQ